MDIKHCSSYKNDSADSASILTLDGIRPQFVYEPSSGEEAAEILFYANRKCIPLCIFGGGTKIRQGAPLEESEWALSTQKLYSEPVVNVDDLIISTQAGVPLKELQGLLSQKNLFLPLDPAVSDETIGGSIAYGGGSSHRLGYGLVCDSVLGMTVALTDGKLYRFGGKTVKNVAGYDFGKLFIGSKGTLGLITELNLRIYAVPPSSKMLIVYVKNQNEVWETVKSIMELQPVVLEVYDSILMKELINHNEKIGYFLIAKYSGPVPSVEKKVKQTLEIARNNNLKMVHTFQAEEEKPIMEKRATIINCDKNNSDEESLVLKISVPPVEVSETIDKMEQISHLGSCEVRSMLMPGAGITYVFINGKGLKEILSDIEKSVAELNGTVILQSGPLSFRKEFSAKSWREWDLKIKEFFDPSKILNPGKRP